MGEYTNEDLKKMQSWGLQKKIQVSTTRLLEWYRHWNGKCYVSFSGGKDSTVLADLAARVCKITGYKLTLWFSDTGLEFPEVRSHVKSYGDWLKQKYNIAVETIIDYPEDKDGKRINFRKVIEEYGYPVISKEVARDISAARNKPNGKTMQKFVRNSDYHKKYGDGWLLERYAYLLNAPFKISNRCCTIMKKKPAHNFNIKSGNSLLLGLWLVNLL